jgi:hypothetical protein
MTMPHKLTKKMKKPILILAFAMITMQAQAEIDPKDARLIKGTAASMTMAKRCGIAVPTKAEFSYKILYTLLDRKMFLAALDEADATVSSIMEKKLGKKFCEDARRELESFWKTMPDDPFH